MTEISNTKRYIISTGITFITGFVIMVTPYLTNLTVEDVINGAAIGILFAGVRAGIKAVAEKFIL